MKYSLDKIAKELGLSKATVSLVLNDRAEENRISPETVKTVKEFCQKVNYVPNIHAIRANSKFAKNIGLLIHENLLKSGNNPFSDQNTAEITGGVVSAAAKKGFRVTIQFYNRDMEEADIFNWLRDREIDGMIYYGYSFDESWHQCFIEEKRNVVGIGIEPREGIATVNVDNVTALYEISKMLLHKGRRRFVYMAGEQDCYVSQMRKCGLEKALKEQGLALQEVLLGDFSEEVAYDLIRKETPDADAIVCANDDMAMGVIRALKEKGVRVPEDISVTGADGIKAARYFSPAVATMDNRNEELGKRAFEEIMNLMKGKKPRNIIVESRIVPGTSC